MLLLLLLPLYFSCCVHFDRCGILKFTFACEIHLEKKIRCPRDMTMYVRACVRVCVCVRASAFLCACVWSVNREWRVHKSHIGRVLREWEMNVGLSATESNLFVGNVGGNRIASLFFFFFEFVWIYSLHIVFGTLVWLYDVLQYTRACVCVRACSWVCFEVSEHDLSHRVRRLNLCVCVRILKPRTNITNICHFNK